MLIRKLFRTARAYRPQFISMIIMVALGVGVFLGFNMEWYSIEWNTGSFFEETRLADYRLYSETGFSRADLEALLAQDGVDAATRMLSVNVGIQDTEQTLSLNVCEDYTVSTMLVTEGAPYDPQADGLWLSDRFAGANGIAVGDTLTLVYRGFKITAPVLGLAKSGEQLICVGDNTQVMPDYTKYGFAYLTPKRYRAAILVDFYPQINLRSPLGKEALEAAAAKALGRTIMVVPKEDTTSYGEAMGESKEGKAMGSILPVLFLAIALLAMTTTMHRITANEKRQIGTLKALGFKDRRIMRHYASYGLTIGLVGTALGIALGYGICYLIMNPNGMMGTYFDMPRWDLVMPGFCWGVLALIVGLMTLISLLSVRKMLSGTAAEALQPYVPRRMRRIALERTPLWKRLQFGTRWNLRDVLRHKSRSAMTLIGIVGCMILLVGGLGMRDTLNGFLKLIDEDVSNYVTRVNLAENSDNARALELAQALDADWEAMSGISVGGKTVMLEVADTQRDKYRFVDEDNAVVPLSEEGAYVCMRLAKDIRVGDTVTFSPYGASETYSVKVIGVLRSVMTENLVMSRACAERVGVPYTVTTLYTDVPVTDLPESGLIASAQSHAAIMQTYDSFTQIMDLMIALLIVAAVVLGVVVLYNLGLMSYIERARELATLKVLGFGDRQIGKLLISQNVWLTVVGVLLGIPAGALTLKVLIDKLAGEYELRMCIGPVTYMVSIALTFGVSLFVGVIVARKNRKIDMVEALKGVE
ncbi:MAG: FtsX-like permease family protein [Clostridia bacterium]|nr:FtsX-like permease family protein [Clostridia bacterium]